MDGSLYFETVLDGFPPLRNMYLSAPTVVTKIETCAHCLSKYSPANRNRARRHEANQCKPGKVARTKEN